MEISEIILTKALQASSNSTLHIELQSILQKLEGITAERLLSLEKETELQDIENEIRVFFSRRNYYNLKEKTEKFAEIAQIIRTEKKYLLRGISNGDVESILIFLLVNCYLQIDIEKILNETEINECLTIPLSDNIFNILNKIKLEIGISPNAPRYEMKALEFANDGISANNIGRTYQLIESMERGGSGFNNNFLLQSLIQFFVTIHFPYFVKVLSAVVHPLTFVFYLQNFKVEILNQLANEPLLKNRWLNFELIRKITIECPNQIFQLAECIAITNALRKIESDDFSFFQQTIKYFTKSIIFNASLGELTASFSEENIIRVIDCFEFNKYSSFLAARDKFLDYFLANCSEQSKLILLENTYERWVTFIEQLFLEDDFFLNELLITDFANFVVLYYTTQVEDQEIIQQLKTILNNIKYINSEWSLSETNELSKYHLYNSQLYLLSFAYRNKELIDSHVIQLFAELKQDDIQILRYCSDHKKYNQLIEIEKNINWNSSG
ncbi:hypothetical protein [Leptospira bouyouniensis]|uniref:Uncharacterized protein n=1 Tax=Leptospira bouyouniensis TaxID=2484911 RepID=A0ABY2L2Q7_9LEPT|nr:hypothetical protein [Leptospira bouyouniensis]TGK45940.1 hypothetical protein EHQ10_18740 [Leptospira bouyouniensis]